MLDALEQPVAILTLLVIVVFTLTGARKWETNKPVSVGLLVFDLISAGLTIYLLGWLLGGGLLILTVLLTFVGTGMWKAIKHDDLLTAAAVANCSNRADMKALADRIGRRPEKARKVFAPLRTAETIFLLAERGRSIPEIEAIVPQIISLWTLSMYQRDAEWSLKELVDAFDQGLRSENLPARHSGVLADRLAVRAQRSPLTLRQLLEAPDGRED